jgi:hypothetical protein
MEVMGIVDACGEGARRTGERVVAMTKGAHGFRGVRAFVGVGLRDARVDPPPDAAAPTSPSTSPGSGSRPRGLRAGETC